MSVSTNSAHQILDVKPDANAEEIRKAYLGLVRKHPPDRDPDKFREIHAAYQMLNDPMVQAAAMADMSWMQPVTPRLPFYPLAC